MQIADNYKFKLTLIDVRLIHDSSIVIRCYGHYRRIMDTSNIEYGSINKKKNVHSL